MKILDYFSIDNGLFTYLKDMDNDRYIKLFGETLKPSDYDLTFLSICGERTAAPIVRICAGDKVTLNADDKNRLALIIWTKYGDAWEKIFDALHINYDATNNYSMQTDVTENVNGNTTTDGATESVNKVYGFDSTDASDDETNNITNRSTVGNDSTRKTTTTVKGNTGGATFSQAIKSEIDLRRTSFLEVVMTDLKNVLTLSIYE